MEGSPRNSPVLKSTAAPATAGQPCKILDDKELDAQGKVPHWREDSDALKASRIFGSTKKFPTAFQNYKTSHYTKSPFQMNREKSPKLGSTSSPRLSPYFNPQIGTMMSEECKLLPLDELVLPPSAIELKEVEDIGEKEENTQKGK